MARGKISEIQVLNPKKVKPEFELLYEQNNQTINRLIEIYKENPYHARIIFKQANKQEYQRNRVVAFTFENGDINIVQFINSFGITVTNKMHQSERNNSAIIYKKETNKWYYKTKAGIRLLDYTLLNTFIGNCSSYYSNTNAQVIKVYMFKLLPWLRNLEEDKYNVSHTVSFNTIIANKLFNLKSIYRYVFDIPYPVAEMMMNHLNYRNRINPIHFPKVWKEMKKYLLNVENLKIEMFGHESFMDACKMAASVNQKINCSWSLKRFITEHDVWAKEISNVLLLNQKNSKMNIYHIYEDFAEFSGWELLKTNFDMVHDGLMMSHCVATYIDKVNNGQCGIYKIDGHTMELNFGYGKINNQKVLEIGQIKGYKNAAAPKELIDEVNYLLYMFNTEALPTIKLEDVVQNRKYDIWGEDMPF